MKVLAWVLGISISLVNIDIIWKVLDSSKTSSGGISVAPIALIAFVFIQQKFPEDKKLTILSKLCLSIFIIAVLVVLWNKFLR